MTHEHELAFQAGEGRRRNGHSHTMLVRRHGYGPCIPAMAGHFRHNSQMDTVGSHHSVSLNTLSTEFRPRYDVNAAARSKTEVNALGSGNNSVRVTSLKTIFHKRIAAKVHSSQMFLTSLQSTANLISHASATTCTPKTSRHWLRNL